jgi:hypothetical protein
MVSGSAATTWLAQCSVPPANPAPRGAPSQCAGGLLIQGSGYRATRNGQKRPENRSRVADLKPIRCEFRPTTKTPCERAKRPEVAAAPLAAAHAEPPHSPGGASQQDHERRFAQPPRFRTRRVKGALPRRHRRVDRSPVPLSLRTESQSAERARLPIPIAGSFTIEPRDSTDLCGLNSRREANRFRGTHTLRVVRGAGDDEQGHEVERRQLDAVAAVQLLDAQGFTADDLGGL